MSKIKKEGYVANTSPPAAVRNNPMASSLLGLKRSAIPPPKK